MPPKKAAVAKASSTAKSTASKTDAVTKKAPVAKKDAKPVASTKAKVNGVTTKAVASKKRKAEETESSDNEEVAPVVKKAKTAAAPAAAPKKAPAKKAEPKTKPSVAGSKAKPKPAAAPKSSKAASTKKRTAEGEATDEGAAAASLKSKKAKSASPAVDSQATVSVPPEDVKPPKSKAASKAKADEKPTVAKKHAAIGKKINDAPTQVLDVYVFGEGSNGELGLGSKKIDGKKPIDVKRPRLNVNLSSKTVGVVQVSCGGMHVAALTKDNKILTWGVNDQGALGRDTKWDGGLRDMDKESEDSDDEGDDSGLNPIESTPTAVSDEHFAPGTKFVQLVASDSATFALTEDGKVYGWGTFRSSDGILGFSETVKIQPTPVLLPALKNIKSLAAGSNHILALDDKGVVLAWGCGQQNQLGRRIIERNKLTSLVPQGMGLPKNKIVKIACGSYHSFALDKNGQVYSWGLNNFAETGIEDGAGDDDAAILRPSIIKSLGEYKITDIAGGEHHSLACSDDGKLLAWGRVDGHQVGIPLDDLTEDNTIYDERKNPRILFKPTVVEDVDNVASVAAGTDNSFAITKKGEVYAWGFSSNYQTGLGTIEDVEEPTIIENSAIKGKKMVHAGAGGQFSVLCGLPEDAPKTNGVHMNGAAVEADANKENEGAKTAAKLGD